ncbi:hypothetical protein PHMEG_00027106, partial [Phytophthora megakarya]
RWHYVREQVQRGSLELIKVLGEENSADAFTKPLDKSRLAKLNEMMGITVVSRVPAKQGRSVFAKAGPAAAHPTTFYLYIASETNRRDAKGAPSQA